MYFTWLKDGAPLPPNLQIEEKSLNEFSLLMFSDLTARHSGEYTCRVSNHAATVNYTAQLSVKVAPAWATEPLDAASFREPYITIVLFLPDEGASLGGESGEQWEPVGAGEWGVDGGLYRCVADNGVGPPLVKHVNVTVHGTELVTIFSSALVFRSVSMELLAPFPT
uniref:Ig-like domain-containing protein n=1 Tax=Heliothis virescens TaxID=7102 RepID=A0A2A4JHV9_HELVI